MQNEISRSAIKKTKGNAKKIISVSKNSCKSSIHLKFVGYEIKIEINWKFEIFLLAYLSIHEKNFLGILQVDEAVVETTARADTNMIEM